MLHKLYRKIAGIKKSILSEFRILLLKLKYPDIEILGKTFIGKNCEIVCVDGGKLILNNAHINYGSHLHCGKNAILNIESSYVGMNSVIVAINKITIKSNCEIAEMVVIRDQDHNHDLSDILIRKQGYKSGPIIINENSWVGAKATILKSVEIGKNSIVGANAVVTKSFPDSSIILGIPAKRVNS